MPKIRVLQMIGSLNIGGSQAFVLSIYRNINREEIQFDFIVDHPDQLYYKDEIEKLGGRIFYMPTFTGINIRQVKKAWNKFFEEHPEYKVLHSHVRSYASLYLPIAKKHGVKTIIHSHSTSNGNGVGALVKRVLQYPLRYQGDYFMACSDSAGEWLFGKKLCRSEKYLYIPNAIDLSKFVFSDDERDKLREKYKFEGKKVLIHVGRFHEAKNHTFLISMFREVHKRDANTLLVLVGDGDLRDSIIKQVSDYNLVDSVRLLGYRDDIPQLLYAADIFVFPSIWEGLGVSAIEAQAARLPSIISDTVPEAVNVSSLCHRLPLDNMERWIDLVCSDMERRNVLDDIRKAEYDISVSANKVESVYKYLWEKEH